MHERDTADALSSQPSLNFDVTESDITRTILAGIYCVDKFMNTRSHLNPEQYTSINRKINNWYLN